MKDPTTMTRLQAEARILEACQLQLEKEKLENELSVALASVQEKFVGKISSITTRLDTAMEDISSWFESNPEEHDKGTKHIKFPCATVGMRDNPPKVDKLKDLKWETIVKVMKANKEWAPYLRQPEKELNKEAILAARETLGADKLRSVGILIKQGSVFYLEPAGDPDQSKMTVPA